MSKKNPKKPDTCHELKGACLEHSEWEMRRDNMDSTCGNVKEKRMEEIDGGDSGNREFVFVYF